MENVIVPYQIGYTFGVGVDSATGGRRQLGAKGEAKQIEGISGGEGSLNMMRIEKTSDLEEHLGISAEASGGIGLFSASARFSFAKDCKVQTNSIMLLITATKSAGFTQIDEPVLDPEASQLVKDGNLALFQQRYGEYFVAGLTSGGQFFGVIRIDSKSTSSSQQIETALSASYGTFSAEVGINVSNAVKKTSSHAEAQLYYEGGDVKTVVRTPDDLFTAADEWEQSWKAEAKPYAALLLPWAIANGPQPPNAEDLEHQRYVLKSCAKLRSQVLDRVNILEYMIDPRHTPDFATNPGDAQRLADLHKKVSGDYDVIMKAASFALDHVKDAVEPETFAQTKMQPAIPNFTITVFGPEDLPKRVDGSPVTLPTPGLKPFAQVLGRQLSHPSGIDLRYLKPR